MDQQKRRKEGNEEKCTKVVVILSKKEQKILYLEQFKENLERVKKLFPDIPNATDQMSVLLELIEAVQDPEYLKNHFQEIREIIPLYMSFDRNDLSEPAQVLDNYFAVRHAALKNDACELNEFLTMKMILPVLSRSDEKMDISQEANKFVDRDGILDKIGKEINKKYSSFCNECIEIMQKSKPMPTVRMVLKKTIFSSPRVFPILPALFSLDAVNQVLGGRKEAKTKLLMPDSSLPQLDRQANELSSIWKQEQQLVRNIQKMLLKEMDDFYQPMLVYKPLNQSQSMQAALRSSANLGWRETKPSFKKLTCKPYGILFCRTDRLAIDLALYCKLSSEKMLHLREQLPQYVMSYKDNQKVLKNEYGDQAAEIIKVFAELIKQDVYACGKSWDENLFEILKSNTKTSQSFFPVKYIDKKQENIDNAYHFFKKYFYNISFYKRIMTRASSILPLLGNKSAFSSYYRNLIDDFMDNAEDTIYDEKSLNATLGFSTKVLRDENTLRVPSYLKRSIRECMTTKRAIDIIKSYKETKNGNIAKLRKYEKELLKDPHSLNYLSRGDSETLSVYQYLLKVSCDIIGHYCAIKLLRCNTIRLENMISTYEEKSKATSI